MNDDDDGSKPDQLARLRAAFDGLGKDLIALRDGLADVNSRFPATKAFLAMHGVENVMQLTEEQRAELLLVLQAERDKLYGPSN